MDPVVIVHGGAGDIPDTRVFSKTIGVKKAAAIGYKILCNGGNVLDAVEASVVSMEDDPSFNAGYGSVLNLDGKVEMEASMQRGSDLKAGCVALIQEFRHPISLARKVLEETPHAFLGGEGAKRFAIEKGFQFIDPNSLITKQAQLALEHFIEKGGTGRTEIGHHSKIGFGTVGAVGIDSEGKIAVATSTGGITGKYVGRIGDTPQIGSGTYADDNIGGVSTTGHGESILKVCLAHKIIMEMQAGATAQEATTRATNYMTERLNNTAGAITLSKTGDVGVYFTSNRMAWCYIKNKIAHFGINSGEDHIANLEEIRMGIDATEDIGESGVLG